MSVYSVGYVLLMAVLWIGMWRVGDREPKGWLITIGARLAIVVWSTLMRVPALVPITLAFVLVDWRNYVRWRKDREISNKIAEAIVQEETTP